MSALSVVSQSQRSVRTVPGAMAAESDVICTANCPGHDNVNILRHSIAVMQYEFYCREKKYILKKQNTSRLI